VAGGVSISVAAGSGVSGGDLNGVQELEMERYNWSQLSPLQLGRYAEYFVKMEFTLYGFDLYTSEVDDRGIDFVIRKGQDRYYDIQVKSVYKAKYIFFPKYKFELRDNLFAAVVIFVDLEAPKLYLIQATTWQNLNALVVSYDYEKRKSKPEWGLNLSPKNLYLLADYSFEKVAATL
jgi:hypothetical protein